MVVIGEVLVNSEDGKPVITRADPIAGFSLELLNAKALITVSGELIEILDQVVYRVVGYRDGYLIAELVEDKRPV